MTYGVKYGPAHYPQSARVKKEGPACAASDILLTLLSDTPRCVSWGSQKMHSSMADHTASYFLHVREGTNTGTREAK